MSLQKETHERTTSSPKPKPTTRPTPGAYVAPDAGQILRRNVYGWFERAERGVYRLTEVGEAALQRWPVLSVLSPIEVSAGMVLAPPP